MTVLTPEFTTTAIENKSAVTSLSAEIRHQRALVSRFRKEANILAQEADIQRVAVGRQKNSINQSIEGAILTQKIEALQLALRNYNRELFRLRDIGGRTKPERIVTPE